VAGIPANRRQRWQIFIRPLRDYKPDGTARAFSPSKFEQRDAEFSPDGRWMAYVSKESGADEVYVQPFPGPGEKHKISSDGGTNPAWSRNGRELFYMRKTNDEKRAMMAADVSTSGDFKAESPHSLFEGAYGTTRPLRSYDVTSDGRFVMVKLQPVVDQLPVNKINVVLGWADELKRRVPSRQP